MTDLTHKTLDELSALYSALPRAHLDAVIAAQGVTDDDGTGRTAPATAEAEIDVITRRIEAILRR